MVVVIVWKLMQDIHQHQQPALKRELNVNRQAEDNVESADDDDEEDEQSSSDLEDNTTYQDWLAEAKEMTGDLWNMKYDKYTSEGMNEDQASEKANMKTQWAVKRNFFARFKDFLSSYLHLKE